MSYFEQYIQSNYSNYCFNTILDDKYFSVDYKALIADEIFSSWDNFKVDIINNTEYYLKCFGLAMHQFIINYQENKNEQDENVIDSEDIPLIQARIINFEPILQLKNLKVIYYGEIVYLFLNEGNVTIHF